MAGKKNSSNGLPGPSPENSNKKTPSAKKYTTKNILQFETLISGFSASLTSTPEENLENELRNWLERFVRFLKVERCIVNEFLEDGETVRRLMHYTVPEIDIAPVSDSYRPPEGSIEAMKKGVMIKAEKIPVDLPLNFRGGIIEETNTKSVLIAPLTAGNNVIGSLLFASYRKRRRWSDGIIRRIKLICEIIANAILRIRSHKSLFREMERRAMLEKRYTTILENANVGFVLADYENNILYVNDEYCRMSGFSRDELYSKRIHDLQVRMNPDEEKRVADELATTGATHHEATHKKKNGSLMDLDVSSTVLDENAFFSFMRDITELNQAKREREERLRFEEVVSEFSAALIDMHPDDINKGIEKWLEQFVSILGVDRGIVNEYLDNQRNIRVLMQYTVPEVNVPLELLRKTPEGVMDELKKGVLRTERIPEDLPRVFRGTHVTAHRTKSIVVVPLISESEIIGNLTFVSYRKERRWPDDLVIRIKIIAEIIANAICRKRSSDALHQEMKSRYRLEEKYASIIKHASVGFVLSDHDQNILDVNDEYCRMSGYGHDELVKMRIADIDCSGGADDKVTRDGLLTVASGNGLFQIQTRHVHKNGRIFDVEVNTQYLEDEGIFFSFVRDVSELNRARRELERRLQFEEIVSEFSTALINIKPTDIKDELGKWLIRFVALIEADRCAVNEYGDDLQTIQNLMQYTVPECKIYVPDARKTPADEIKQLEKGVIRAEKIPEDLPEMYKGSFIDRSNAKSVIIVPLLTGNRIFGNLAFANYRKERKWSDELTRRITLIAEIVGNAILRLRSHEALIEEMSRRHMLEERYSSIIETANVGFMISDLNAGILEVNDAYCEMSGYSRDELTGMKIYQLDISGDSEKVAKDKDGIFETGSFHHETRHIRKDGRAMDVLVSANILEKERLVCCFIRDVTELNIARREVEERLKFEELTSEFSAALVNAKLEKARAELDVWLKRFSELLNVDRCAIGQFSHDYGSYRFVCTYTNPALTPVPAPFPEIIYNEGGYGLERYLMKGEAIKLEKADDWFPEDLTNWKNEVLADGIKSVLTLPLISGDTLLGTMFIATITHEQKWGRDLVRRLRLVAEIYANTLMRDRADRELKNYQNHLERMVEERTAKLEEAQKELVISEKMATLGRLTATVSHELRNPLGTIKSSVYYVQKRLENQDEKIVRAVERAERGIARCDLIIGELLDYSRMPGLKLESTSIDAWISEILSETEPPTGISLKKELDSGATIEMDKERFRQSMVNLLTNAYQSILEKGIDETGCVAVVTRKDNKNLVVEIEDNGKGFDMEDKDKIFEPLYSTKTFGVGLGIPIARQIIEQHGWNMDITGAPQKGATVTVTIPLQ